jgi:hypothetical protein
MQRSKFIAKFLDDRKHDWYRDAKCFTYLSEGIKLHRWQGEELGQAMELFPRNHDLWTTRYSGQVDFIFVTNSSSAHDMVTHHANPNVLISEEAAHATMVDIVTPAAAHVSTMELWIASGDLQHHPPKLSPDNNEMYPEVQDPLLTKWMEDVTLDVCCFLTLQPRMRPIHSELLSCT